MDRPPSPLMAAQYLGQQAGQIWRGSRLACRSPCFRLIAKQAAIYRLMVSGRLIDHPTASRPVTARECVVDPTSSHVAIEGLSITEVKDNSYRQMDNNRPCRARLRIPARFMRARDVARDTAATDAYVTLRRHRRTSRVRRLLVERGTLEPQAWASEVFSERLAQRCDVQHRFRQQLLELADQTSRCCPRSIEW